MKDLKTPTQCQLFELIADGCDKQSLALMQVLPAVYLFIGKALHATPAQLGTLTLCRALVQVGLPYCMCLSRLIALECQWVFLRVSPCGEVTRKTGDCG